MQKYCAAEFTKFSRVFEHLLIVCRLIYKDLSTKDKKLLGKATKWMFKYLRNTNS